MPKQLNLVADTPMDRVSSLRMCLVLLTKQKRRSRVNVAKQVSLRRDVPCYRAFHFCFVPSFIFLDASVKFWRLGKLSHPSPLSGQVQTAIFFSEIAVLNYKISNSSLCLYVDPQYPSLPPKKSTLAISQHVTTIFIHIGDFC